MLLFYNDIQYFSCKKKLTINFFRLLSEKIRSLESSLEERDSLLEQLSAKYTRHRTVWQENEAKSDAEIKNLDRLIDSVIAALRESSDLVSKCPRLSSLLEHLTSGQVSGSTQEASGAETKQKSQAAHELHVNNVSDTSVLSSSGDTSNSSIPTSIETINENTDA